MLGPELVELSWEGLGGVALLRDSDLDDCLWIPFPLASDFFDVLK